MENNNSCIHIYYMYDIIGLQQMFEVEEKCTQKVFNTCTCNFTQIFHSEILKNIIESFYAFTVVKYIHFKENGRQS